MKKLILILLLATGCGKSAGTSTVDGKPVVPGIHTYKIEIIVNNPAAAYSGDWHYTVNLADADEYVNNYNFNFGAGQVVSTYTGRNLRNVSIDNQTNTNPITGKVWRDGVVVQTSAVLGLGQTWNFTNLD